MLGLKGVRSNQQCVLGRKVISDLRGGTPYCSLSSTAFPGHTVAMLWVADLSFSLFAALLSLAFTDVHHYGLCASPIIQTEQEKSARHSGAGRQGKVNPFSDDFSGVCLEQAALTKFWSRPPDFPARYDHYRRDLQVTGLRILHSTLSQGNSKSRGKGQPSGCPG